jgi:hypothetical protein
MVVDSGKEYWWPLLSLFRFVTTDEAMGLRFPVDGIGRSSLGVMAF